MKKGVLWMAAVGAALTWGATMPPVCAAQSGAGLQTAGDQSAADLVNEVKELRKEVEDLRAQVTALKSSAYTAASATGEPRLVYLSGTSPNPTPTAAPAAAAPAQNAAASATPAPTTLSSLLGPTTLSGFVDGYYQQNFENPTTRASGLRTFDALTNQFGLNLIELVIDKPPAAESRTGYHIALGFGQAINAINAANPGDVGFDQYLKEGYFSYLAPVGKGLQVDMGKFVTPAGAEVIETKDNWNYSRSLLFNFAIPFFHYGMRAKYAFNDKYSLTGYIMNGWNDIVDNNTGKTYGMTFGWNPNKKWSVAENYLAGPEGANNNGDWRQLTDTVVTFNPTAKLSLMANVDYGRGDRIVPVAKPVWWSGVAGYIKYALNSKYALAARYEYYDDHNGFTTATTQHLHEVTGTFERTIASHIISRFEFRRDMSNQPVFAKGVRPVKDQNTITGGFVFVFDSKGESK